MKKLKEGSIVLLGLVLAVTLVLGFIKAKAVYQAESTVGTCYLSEQDMAVFQVVGYETSLFSVDGTYYIDGFVDIFPIQGHTLQSNFHEAVDNGGFELIDCQQEWIDRMKPAEQVEDGGDSQ